MVLTLVFSPENLLTIPTGSLFFLCFTCKFMSNASCHSVPYLLAFVACSVGKVSAPALVSVTVLGILSFLGRLASIHTGGISKVSCRRSFGLVC